MIEFHDTPRARGVARWLSFTMLVLPSTLTSVDSTVLQLAVPHLSAALHPTGAQLLWILDSYGLVTICLLIPMGAIADRIGRRRMLLIGVAIFGSASLLAAFATSATMLILARAIMGVGAGALLPSTLSLISVLYPDEHERSSAISIWLGGSMAGMIAGPLIGGLLLNSFWWGSVFLLGVPVMLLVLVMGPALLPDYRTASSTPFDHPSILIAVLGMFLFVFGAQHFSEGSSPALAIAALVVGFALLVAFVRRQRRLPDPVLDVGLFANRRFGTVVAAMCTAAGVISGTNFFVSQQLQSVFRLSATEAGLVLAPAAAASIVGYLASARLQRRFGTRSVLSASLMVGALGIATFGIVAYRASVAAVLVAGVVMSIGLSAAIAACSSVIMTTANEDEAGHASVIQEVSSQLGVVLGFAVIGTVGTALYRTLIGRNVPIGTSADVLARINSTIGEAVTAPGVSPDVVNAAREAFSTSFAWCAGTSAVVMVALAVLSGRALQTVGAQSS